MLNYYVDPGSGFVFFQNTSFFWGVILGLLGGIFLSFKLFFKFLKRFLGFIFILLAVIIIIWGLIMSKPSSRKKVIILGIDAMDPGITEQLIKEGRLPNLSYLKAQGAYK